MPRLFSYGTLQLERVQLSTFGRLLNGAHDELVGFEPGLVAIEDPDEAAALGTTNYANVVPNGLPDSRVAGTVFDVTDAELAAADRYEEPASYVRIQTTLASGTDAWVYVYRGQSTTR